MREKMMLVPMVVEQTSRGERSLIFIRACCAIGSCSSTAKSMTTWLKCCAPSCCFWRRKTRKTDPPVYQLAGRGDHQRAGDLRHHAVHPCAGAYPVHGHRAFDGLVPADGRRTGAPHGAAQRQPARAPAAGRLSGQASDILIHAEEMKRTKERVIRLYAQHCGLSDEAVELALDRDRFMTADEAAAWG